MKFSLVFRIVTRLFLKHRFISILMIINLFVGLVIPIMLSSYESKILSALSSAGKGLLGADFKISSRIEPRNSSIKKSEEILKGIFLDRTRIYSMFTMAKSQTGLSLVQLRIIDGVFPFYGDFKTTKGLGLLDLGEDEVFVKEEVLLKFKVKVGDFLRIKERRFKIIDVISKDSGQSLGMGNMAPRVYVNLRANPDFDIFKTGSIIGYTYLYKTKIALDEKLYEKITSTVLDTELRFTLPSQSNSTFSRGIGLVLDFSQLIFICGILISIAAYFYIFKHFLELEKKNIDVYYNLGIKPLSISLIYIGHVFVCFFLTIFAAICCLYLFVDSFNLVFKDFLPSGVSFTSDEVSIPFSFIALLGLFVLSFITPVVLSKIKERGVGVFYWLPSLCIFFFILVLQTKSYLWAPLLFGGMLILGALAYLVVPSVLTPLSLGRSLTMQLAFKSLIRNRSVLFTRFSMIVMTFTVINIIPIVFTTLRSDLNFSKNNMPEYFLFDIQQEQLEDLNTFLNNEDIESTQFTPMIRARMTLLNNMPVMISNKRDGSREQEANRRTKNRGVNISYKDKINSSENISKGVFSTHPYSGEGPIKVSIEEKYAKRIGVSLGDTITYSIFDFPYKTIVTSIRKVKWTSLLPNFFIIFQKGVLDDAPKTYLTTISNLNSDYSKIIRLNDKFSNITSINVKSLMKEILNFLSRIEKVLQQMTIVFLVITLLAFFSLNYFQLKICKSLNILYSQLGLQYRAIRNIHLFSYLGLVAISILTSVILANTLVYFITHYFMQLDFKFTTDYLGLNLIPLLGICLYNKRMLKY